MDQAEVLRCRAEVDPSDVNVEQFFTADELQNICEYEMNSLRNMKLNYDMMLKFGTYSQCLLLCWLYSNNQNTCTMEPKYGKWDGYILSRNYT